MWKAALAAAVAVGAVMASPNTRPIIGVLTLPNDNVGVRSRGTERRHSYLPSRCPCVDRSGHVDGGDGNAHWTWRPVWCSQVSPILHVLCALCHACSLLASRTSQRRTSSGSKAAARVSCPSRFGHQGLAPVSVSRAVAARRGPCHGHFSMHCNAVAISWCRPLACVGQLPVGSV